jgi:hypothetical protein
MVETAEKEGFSLMRSKQNPLQSPLPLNCVLYTNLRRTATNFCGIGVSTSSRSLEISRVKQSGRVWGIDDPLLEAGRMANPSLPLAGGR